MSATIVPTSSRQLMEWLEEHSFQPKTLHDWVTDFEKIVGRVRLANVLIHKVGSDATTLKTNFRAASNEISRRGGIIGSWSAVREDGLHQATVILGDKTVARLFFQAQTPKYWWRMHVGTARKSVVYIITDLCAATYAEAVKWSLQRAESQGYEKHLISHELICQDTAISQSAYSIIAANLPPMSDEELVAHYKEAIGYSTLDFTENGIQYDNNKVARIHEAYN